MPVPRPARPSRPWVKRIFGAFEPATRVAAAAAPAGPPGPPPSRPPVPRDPPKCSRGSRWLPGPHCAPGRAVPAVRAAGEIQASLPRRSPRCSLGVPGALAWRTAPAASPVKPAAPPVQLADAVAAAALSPVAERSAQPLSRTTAYSTNGLRITS